MDESGLAAALDALESKIVGLRLRWWHLLRWFRSPVRPLTARFQELEPSARAVLEQHRVMREEQWAAAADKPSLMSAGLLSLVHLGLQNRETILTSRLERVRLLLMSKESEEHARRGVWLGVIGLILGVISLVLGVISVRQPDLRDLLGGHAEVSRDIGPE